MIAVVSIGKIPLDLCDMCVSTHHEVCVSEGTYTVVSCRGGQKPLLTLYSYF